MNSLLLLALLLQTAVPAPVTTSESLFLKRTFRTMPYRILVPRGYDAKKRYPLIVYLHGAAGIGTDNAHQIRGGNGLVLDLFVREQKTYPSFIVVPQSHGVGWADPVQLKAVPDLVSQVTTQYSIDRRRIYIGGQSLGGSGTYALANMRPDLFAAAFVLSGGADEALARALARVPLWIFHGSADRIVPVNRAHRMRDAIRKAGGVARYTEYRGEGHQIWPHVGAEKELLVWLFTQVHR